MAVYLYYDVKGIQSFIFKIPRLKFIVGGSALIDQFDKETVGEMNGPDTEVIFTGGGRGVFFCGTAGAAQNLKEKIKTAARSIGLDIRFGLNENFNLAVQNANELYAFVPKKPVDGVPCPKSGIYPVEDGVPCHPVVKKRRINSEKKVFRRFEDAFLSDVLIPGKPKGSLEFFHNVSSDKQDGKAGAAALGNRNRWAVICMDGNNIGKQFRTQLDRKLLPEEMKTGIKKMSKTLVKITAQATLEAVQHVVSQWAGNEGKETVITSGKVTLPIRPLLVGGDDVIVLCHCSYAAVFVKEMTRVFELESREHQALWPATSNGLTICAGILYTSVTFPLHTAIPYAEALLEGAKMLGRELAEEGKAPPACIDWEQITETVIDTPQAKRQRELTFFDCEVDRTIKLTRRPYTLAEFTEVESLATDYGKGIGTTLPRTIRYKILPALKKGQADRLAFVAQIKKNHPKLFDALNELTPEKSHWHIDYVAKEQTIGIADALMLLEEDKRMEQETVR
jgi:hypothetical protein